MSSQFSKNRFAPFLLLSTLLSMMCVAGILKLQNPVFVRFFLVLISLNCISSICGYFLSEKLNGQIIIDWWKIQVLLCPALLMLGLSIVFSLKLLNQFYATLIIIGEISLSVLMLLGVSPFIKNKVVAASNSKIHSYLKTTGAFGGAFGFVFASIIGFWFKAQDIVVLVGCNFLLGYYGLLLATFVLRKHMLSLLE